MIYSYLSDLKTPVKPVSLFDAIAKGDLKKIESLLKQGVNPNIRDKDGKTPLHNAAYLGHVAVAKLLLEHGADIHARDNANWTPLHWAAYKGHFDVARLLLERGADPTVKNRDGKTPLDLAKKAGYDGVVSVIEEWLWRGWALSRQREAAEVLPPAWVSEGCLSPSLYGPVSSSAVKGDEATRTP